MESATTLLLNRADVARLLDITECMAAVEKTFGLYAEGKTHPPKILGVHADAGGFHIKTGLLGSYFVAKINANFPNNSKQYGLPAIQGVIVICDVTNGKLLSLMDSIEITIIRTGAATGVAANYLALPAAKVATICGCGNQGKISLKALMEVRKLEKVYVFDTDTLQAEKFAREFAKNINVIAITLSELPGALRQSQVCITCTPSKVPFIPTENIMPGTFIAAVGADNEEKQELFPELMVKNKIVTDITGQCATIGELHHAIEHKLITADCVHAELGEIIAGKKPGRESNEEIIIFDSTGTALQDVASAAIVYEKAIASKIGTYLNFSQQKDNEILEKNSKAIDILKSFYPFR
jgi:ornithine cyclodeaminase/alanine dehydrogenase-like protein (mu-crystallin family)